MQSLMPDIASGADILLVARQPLAQSTLEQARTALLSLFRRAGLMISQDAT
jgi:hypothetical protein